jgi:hypothetical protein
MPSRLFMVCIEGIDAFVAKHEGIAQHPNKTTKASKASLGKT